MKKKAAICFVDDDMEERERFRSGMADRYVVGVGPVLDDALEELRKIGRRPNFFLPDLVYGKTVSRAVQNHITAADDEFSRAEDQVRRLLELAEQSAEKGFDRADDVRVRYPTGFAGEW
jgi:hypothetical protein